MDTKHDAGGVGSGCSCDPVINTSDCDQSRCTAFMGTFLFFEIVVLIAYAVLLFIVEYKSKKKSNLWRIILPACFLGCLAKVIRLGILANPDTRYSVGQVTLVFLYNTHLCMATFGFITLLFFWMRLKHDLIITNNTFGKLTPAYIAAITITVVFYYAQVIVKGTIDSDVMMFVLLLVNGLVSFILGSLFLGYTIVVWRSFLQNDSSSLFYRTFVSAILTSVLIIAFCIEVLVSNVTDYNTTTQYLIKHAVYEILFLAQFCAIPSGFVLHYYKHHISKIERSSSEHSMHSMRSMSGNNLALSASTTCLTAPTTETNNLSPSTSSSSLTAASLNTSTSSLNPGLSPSNSSLSVNLAFSTSTSSLLPDDSDLHSAA